MLFCACMLTSCAGPSEKSGESGGAFDLLFGVDLTAKKPLPMRGRGDGDEKVPPAQVYSGLDGAVGRTAPGTGAGPAGSSGAPGTAGSTTGTFDLNFENADIAAVTKSLLGDVLSLNYSIDPRVQGQISLSSGRPIMRSQVLPLLEAALKVSNAAVVKDGPIYRIVPISEAIGSGPTDNASTGAPEPGYGISVVPLKYVAASAVIRVVESFAARPGAVRIEPGTNLLIVQGSSTERASAMEAALALDVDFLKNQSVGIYPVKNGSPEAIIAELQNVLGTGEGGTGQNLVKFLPISRLNAVLAVAKTKEQINQVTAWVGRLDQADYGNTSLRVYRVRFGSAKVIAGLLNEIFTGKAGTPGTSDLSQLTPGVSVQRSISDFGSGATSVGSSQFANNQNTGSGGGGDISSDGDGDSGIAGAGTQTGNGSTTPGTAANNGPGPFPNVRISADVGNNSLLIYASREQYRAIERAVEELDKAPLQVAIDTIIAEVTLKDDLQYGVQFFLKSKDVNLSPGKGSIGLGQQAVLERLIPGFNLVLGPKQDPRLILSALRTLTTVKVLSSPSLVVLDNHPATLQVGDQVPIATRSATSVDDPDAPLVNNIDFRNTGVILSVTPRVNSNGVVSLDVEQEISNVVNNGDQATLTPTISQRRVKSSIAVASGQTVLLGGLISDRKETNKSGIPILGDLKAIGPLFSTTRTTTNRTELILFIRPQIIRDGVDAQLVSEELRSKVNLLGGGTAGRAKNTP